MKKSRFSDSQILGILDLPPVAVPRISRKSVVAAPVTGG